MDTILKALPVVITVLAVLGLLLSGYVKAPPDKAFIVSGLKKSGKILIGRAGIRIPFLERMDTLYLGSMTVDIKTDSSVPTNDFINVNVDAVAKVRINPSPEGIKNAMKNFLNKDPKNVAMDLQDSLQGNMREIIGTLSLKEINTDRDSFSDQVMQKASKDMDKLGIEILSCNIQNVTDENGLIRDLGADNTALIKKNASIAKAQADRDVAIAQADATKAANEAQVAAETAIAQRTTELAIRKAELKTTSDIKQAEADAAYEIQKQEQQKSIATATVNAKIAQAEREAELKTQEIEVATKSMDAEIRATADAEMYRKEREADAELYALEKEAAGIKARGEAEAAAIKAKAMAEAEGINKKAEAMKKYGNAAVIEMIMKALPDIAKNVAEPLSKVEKITMFGEGNNTKLISDIVNSATQVSEGMCAGLGIDLKSLMAGFLGGKIAQPTTVIAAPGCGDTHAEVDDGEGCEF